MQQPPLSLEHKILLGRPDILLVPVGGGPKAYTPEEAAEAIRELTPKVVIPTHYRTEAADANCDFSWGRRFYFPNVGNTSHSGG